MNTLIAAGNNTAVLPLELVWIEEFEDHIHFVSTGGEEFACRDASCAPPPVGTGGSKKTGRVATRIAREGLDHSTTGLRLSGLSADNVEAQFQRLKDKGVLPGDIQDADAAVEWLAGNIERVLKMATPEQKAAWKEWYPAANALGGDVAAKYGLGHSQANAIIAALSPGTEWNKNVAMARSLIDTLSKDTPLDGASAQRANALLQEGWARKQASHDRKMSKAQEEMDSLISKRDSETDPAAIKKLTGQIEKKQTILSQKGPDQPDLEYFKAGDRPSSFSSSEVGYLARGLDPNPEVRVIKAKPDGGYDDSEMSMTKAGNPEKGTWQSYENIAKAVDVFRDPSIETISGALGGAHKVRNFFNNIEDPFNTSGDVTIDTHAYGIGMDNPVSVNHPLIAAGGGSIASSPGHAADGTTGTYALFAEAYTRVAERNNMLPREVQSVTWEKWREIHPPSSRGRETNED